MSDPRSITADAFEILVVRELRRIGVEPVNLRRRYLAGAEGRGDTFDLHGRLEAYGKRWSVVVGCRNAEHALRKEHVHDLRARADRVGAVSAVLFTTTEVEAEAAAVARLLAVPILRVVDAQSALRGTGAIQPGQLPAWLPEFTIEILTSEGSRLLEINEPEVLLRELRKGQ